jgi:hypothetical protein
MGAARATPFDARFGDDAAAGHLKIRIHGFHGGRPGDDRLRRGALAGARIIAAANVNWVTSPGNSDCVPDFSRRDPTASPNWRVGGAFSAFRRFPVGSAGGRTLKSIHRLCNAHRRPHMNAFALLVTFAFFIPIMLTIAGQLVTLEEAVQPVR